MLPLAFVFHELSQHSGHSGLANTTVEYYVAYQWQYLWTLHDINECQFQSFLIHTPIAQQMAAALLVIFIISALLGGHAAVQPSRSRGGSTTDNCGPLHRADYGTLVLDLTLRGGVHADEGDLAATLLVAHELADVGLKVAVGSFSPDLFGNAKRETLHERHHRRLVHCFVPLSPREHPPPKERATAGYGGAQGLRATAARVVGEGFMDALKGSPFDTTLVIVAAPTRLTVCDPTRLAASIQKLHARYTASRAQTNSKGCDGMLALLNGAPLGPSQRFGLPLTAFAWSGRGFLRTWRHLYNEYAALGAAAPQHSLRETLLRRVATTASLDLLAVKPSNASGVNGATAGGKRLEKGGYDDDGDDDVAMQAQMASEAPEANGGCMACGRIAEEAEEARTSCRATLCGHGCAIAFNCSHDAREIRFSKAHTGAAAPDAGVTAGDKEKSRGVSTVGSSNEERAIAWGLLHGETCALRAALMPPHDTSTFSPLARSVLWHAHADHRSSSGGPSALELAARTKRSSAQAAAKKRSATASTLLSSGSSGQSDALPPGMCRAAQASGEARGFSEAEEDHLSTKPLERRRRFLIATVATPDEDSMVAGGSAREPWLEYAAVKQAYASKHGYASELLLPGRLLLAAVSGDPLALLGPARVGLLTRCESLRPLLALDALLRHGSGHPNAAVDYVLVTDHATFVSPYWFNSSLDTFVEVSATARGNVFFF